MIRAVMHRLRRLRAEEQPGPASPPPPPTPMLVQQALAAARAAARDVLVNLGCGARHHADWINIDFHGDSRTVLPWDLREDLPFPDGACDVVYSSHAIEHFTRAGARRLLGECLRVLRPGGVLRIVAPDLEGVVRTYLSCLDAARRGDSGAADRYEWIVIELLDQLVRHRGGGEMLRYWAREVVPAENFMAQRVGTEYLRARPQCKGRVIPDTEPDAAEVGRFRLGGEVHQWMYDSYSLGRLLEDCGFVTVRTCAADESAIPNFTTYNLDTEPDGAVYKPDSFFLEAKGP